MKDMGHPCEQGHEQGDSCRLGRPKNVKDPLLSFLEFLPGQCGFPFASDPAAFGVSREGCTDVHDVVTFYIASTCYVATEGVRGLLLPCTRQHSLLRVLDVTAFGCISSSRRLLSHWACEGDCLHLSFFPSVSDTHEPSCNPIVIGFSILSSFPAHGVHDTVPNKCIGGSGTLTVLCRSLPGLYGTDWTDFFIVIVVSFFRTMLCLLPIAICGLLYGQIFGHRQTCGLHPRSRIAQCLLKPLAFASVGDPVLNWSTHKKDKPGRRHKRQHLRGHSFFRNSWALALLGFCHLPVQVWAVPEGTRTFLAAVPVILDHLPETLSSSSGGADSRSLQVDQVEEEGVVRLPADQAWLDSLHSQEAGQWVGANIYARDYQEISLGLWFQGPPSLAGTSARVARRLRQIVPSLDGLVPVQPPRSCGSLDFLAYATCAERCDLVHIIVDLTSVGGHYFADAVPSHLSVYDFLWQYAEDVKYEVERLDVRVGPQALGRVPSAALGVHTGDAVIVLPAPAPVIWQNRLGSFFEPGHIWTPLRLVPGSPFTPGLAVWLQGCLHSFPGGRLNDADTHARIAQLTGQQRDRMRVVTFQGLHDFALKGELCHSVVVPLDAFLEHNSLSGDNLTLALVDARCLGLSVVVCNLPAGVPSVSDCASAVGITDTHGLNIQVRIVARHTFGETQGVSCLHIQLGANLDSSVGGSHHITNHLTGQPETLPAPLSRGHTPEDTGSIAESSEESLQSLSSVENIILRFHVLCVDHQARATEIAISLPSTVQSAIQAVEQELDDDFYRLFSLLVAMRPQATPEWGLLLALPAWAIDEPVCAIDLLEIDGRVFSVVLPWWFTSRDIIVCADLDPALEYDIFPFGRSTAIDAFEEVNLVRHGLIVVRPRGTEPPVLRHLSDMLSHGIGWDLSTDAPAIVPHDRAGQVCIVLPDRQAPFTLLPGRRQHYHHDLAHAFGVPIHWLTVQVAKPPILDAALHGRACKGVALVCDGVPNVPIPPRRPGPCVFGIVLDCRPLLLGWRQWIVVDSRCQHSQIVEHFGLLSPGEHQVQVEGADIQDDFLLVQPGHVLVLQYVPVTPSSHIPAAEDGAVDITDVGADYVHTDAGIGASLDHTPLDAAPRPGDRSRSPRGRSSAPERHRHGSTAGPEPGGILACALLACLPGAVGAEVPRNFFLEGGYGSCTFDCARGAGDGDFGGQVACRHTFPAYSQYASWHPLAECAITAVFGWSMFVVPVLLKLLVEPSTYTLADAEHLSHMRLLTVRLGGRWLRDNNHWFQDHDFETDPDTDEQGDTLVPPVVCWICCIILKYGYSPEEVVVAAHLPLTLEEFTHLVQDARRGDIKHIYPHLLPVSPQPVFGNAVFLAGPAFAADLLGACLDATLIDGRLFACHVPDYISRHEILQFADLLPSADVEVYIGSDVGAIVDETPFHVFPGVWIRIQPKGCQHPPDACLGLQLLRDVGWSDEAQLPVPVFEGDAYCLVHGGEYCLHFTDPVHPTHYRRYIAARVGLQVADIDVQAAAPRPSDVEICGYPCRSVLAVTHCSDIRQGPARQVVVIDCRPIHEGWCVAFANNGEFASRAFAQGLNQTAPRGWQTSLNVAIDAAGLSRVRAGQVIVVTYAPHGEPTGSAPAAEHSSDAIASPGQDTANRQRDVEHTDTGAAIRTVQTRTQSAAWEDDSFVPFLLFSQEVWPEFVVPQLRLPTDIHSAIASVAQARDAWDHRKRSRLIAVRPQPRWEQICLLALPSWPFQGVVILIDNRIAPGGIFAVNVPSFLVRDDVLRLAEVAEDTRYQVYHGDVPWPCPTGVHIPLEDGDLLTICDGLAGPGRFPDVGQMLTPRWQWEFVPDLPGGSRLTSWVLTDGIHYAVSVDSDTFAANNAEVAERLALPTGQFMLVPATPFIGDHAHRGRASSLVAVACRIEDYSAEHPTDKVPYLLDLRPILLRIGWAYADQGLVDVTELGRRLCVRCPRGHHLRLTGGSYSRDEGNHRRRARPGEVLTAEFLPDYVREAEDLSESDAQVSLSEDGNVLEPYTRRAPNASESSAASSHDGGTGGPRWHTRTRALGTHSQSDACSRAGREDREGGEPRAVCRRSPRVWFDKWICCVLTSRLSDGSSWFTTVIAGLVLASLFLGVALRAIHILAPYIVGGACICQGIRHKRCVLLCVASILLLPVVRAGFTPNQGGDTADRVDVSRPGLGVSAAGMRIIATPCRQRLPTHAESSFSIGPTLLQQSFGRADCHAFFEARALLETLFEHFSGLRRSATSRAPPSTVSECSEASDAAVEPVLPIHVVDAEPQVDQNPVCLRLLEHLPCPAQDLSSVGLHLPFGLDDVQRILRATWTLPTTLPEDLKLHPASAVALNACLPLDALPSGEIDQCEIYTDGAFEQGRSAWAFVVIGYIQRSPLLVGWARGPVVLSDASPWVGAEVHSALNGERTALFWALAWSLQFGSNLPCQVFVDSLVALRQTNGVYGSAADSVIAHACRALAQAADSLGGVRSVSSMSVLTGVTRIMNLLTPSPEPMLLPLPRSLLTSLD